MSINFAERNVGDVTLLDLTGRVAQGETFGLGERKDLTLQDLVLNHAANGHHKILLNFREVSYIDSSGLGGLVACSTAVRDHGGQLRICNISPRVLDLLRITRLESTLNPDKDEATALQAFTSNQRQSISEV